MGHGNSEVVTSHVCMMTNIQRNPTIPMTKRDSLLTNGSRVSLLSNGTSSPVQKKFEEKDYVNSNPNMVSGKKRSPRTTKKVKRTDSYKIATNRQSVDDLDGLSALNFSSDAKRINGARGPRADDRTKYNTLPRTDTLTVQKKISEPKKKKRDSDKPHGDFDRNASQRSGTYPSPDTDEDQRAIEPDRKKKSTFKRMKERLILTFKKDRDNDRDKKKNKKRDKYKSPSSRVKPNHATTGRDAFNTPNDDIEIVHDNNNGQDIKEPHAPGASRGALTKEHSAFETNHKAGVTNGGLSVKGDDVSSQSNKSPGFFRTIRNSFRRKQAPSKFKKEKGSRDTNEDSQYTRSSSQPQSGSSLERDSNPTNSNRGQTSQPIDIQNSSTTVHVHKIEEHFVDADDSITEIFGSLIDPVGSVKSSTVTSQLGRSRPDTSKFKLEGLRKFKPRSFDRSSPGEGAPKTSHAFASDLSPTVEIDGFDYADAPAPTGGAVGNFPEESDLEYSDVSQQEQHRRVDDVARRLAAIGDSIVSRRELESAGSSEELDGFRVGSHGRRLSQLEEELLTELRRYGDDIDGSLFSRGSGIKFSILPVIKGIISAQDYSTFKHVVQREISNTVGWEQVAWYTYIMKATMDLAGAGKTVGTMVKNHATQYFSSTIRPWIQSRPNGWESIHEETDGESEVD